MTALWLKLLGAALLALTGFGAGLTGAAAVRRRGRRLHDYGRLFAFLADEVDARAPPAAELLAMAALQPELAPLLPPGCAAWAALPVPADLDAAAQAEVRAGLRALALADRAAAVQTLARLAALCRRAEAEDEPERRRRAALYPKLGACAGLLAAAILL